VPLATPEAQSPDSKSRAGGVDIDRSSDPLPMPSEGRRRVVIDRVMPAIDGGRFALKRVEGDTLAVLADVFPDGHERIAVRLRHRPPGEDGWQEIPMGEPDDDRWRAEIALPRVGRHEYTVVAWIDAFTTWRHELELRIAADVVSDVDLAIGAQLIRAAATRARAQGAATDAVALAALADAIDGAPTGERHTLARGTELAALMERHPDRRFESAWEPVLAVTVDPPHARFSAWYELFPRSAAAVPGRHGTFRDVIERLPYVADLGFDVLYLPPIHPIGRTFRKGPNNALEAAAGDPGVPWAIGAGEGGHMAIHPELGTLADLDALVAAAAGHGIRIALDIAFQASADHPYVRDHRDWFRARPDGTVQYAENPPKKYQDIYPFDFETDDWAALWRELLEVVRFWAGHGVRIFRVDNPHTKPFDLWEWLIGDVKSTDPDVLFLAEAFTRPKVMYRLAKLGFSQSYTYFTWRIDKAELTSYFEEVTRPPVSEFFRPNLFANTPDILHAYLQEGGQPAFEVRLVLAATLGATYGIYGPPFELRQSTPREPGSEEYLDSEKYELRHWDLDDPRSIAPLIRRVNAIRRAHPALQGDERLWFLPSGDDDVIAYSKHTADRSDVIVTVVNLDPHAGHAARVELPLAAYGLDPHAVEAEDLLTGHRIGLEGATMGLVLEPWSGPARIVSLRPTASGGGAHE
jgi:starch synthase (maltosyl-transferring)